MLKAQVGYSNNTDAYEAGVEAAKKSSSDGKGKI